MHDVMAIVTSRHSSHGVITLPAQEATLAYTVFPLFCAFKRPFFSFLSPFSVFFLSFVLFLHFPAKDINIVVKKRI